MFALYWRISITAIGDLVSGAWYPALSHLRFYNSDGVLVTSGGTASASSAYSGAYSASNAFDEDETNDWATVANDLPAWIQYQFAMAQEVTALRITAGTVAIASPTVRAPKDFTLQSSDNGTDWADVFSYANVTWDSPRQELYFGSIAGRVATPLRRDLEDGGSFSVIEPVTRLDAAQQPCRVRLCDKISGRMVREAWSDAITGDVTFSDLREGPWVLYALDHTNEFEAVAISDRLATADGERP